MQEKRSGGVTATASRQTKGQTPVATKHSEPIIPPLTIHDGRQAIPHSEVEVAMGQTVNLGNYNSLRVDVHVRIPVNRGEEEEGIRYAEKLADEHAERIIQANRFQ